MRALITGGAGFIGSHLCDRLLSEGHKDTILNEQVMHLLVERCDLMFHLAAAVGVKLIVEQPVRTIETNIRGTEVVLEIANKFGKKVLRGDHY